MMQLPHVSNQTLSVARPRLAVEAAIQGELSYPIPG